MASSYPTGLDTGFPGWPYTDYTQYVTAEQANSWITAIQQIETVVGYGAGGSPANPLYSQQQGQTYTSVAARLSAIETSVAGGLKLNSSAGTIQPVGTTAQAGSTGLAADAGHVHAGFSASGLVPIGTIIMWPGAISSWPSNYLLCAGGPASQSMYNTLYNLLGTTYGPASGGNFTLPNFQDKFPIGVGSVVTNSPGQSGGSLTISIANLPSHSHAISVSDSGHAHGSPGGVQFIIGSLPTSTIYTNQGSNTDHGPLAWNLSANPSTVGASANISSSLGNTGGGSNYVQPYLGIYFLIRAL